VSLQIFVSKTLSLAHLACTVLALAVFALKWLQALKQPSQNKGGALIGELAAMRVTVS
jgi:hypothetical protein